MRGGLLPAAAVAASVGVVLVWTWAAHDPYWRLFERPSMPAPAYESPEEIRAALATAVVPTSHPDSAASRPESPSSWEAPDEAEFALLAPRSAVPLIAVRAPLTEDVPAHFAKEASAALGGALPAQATPSRPSALSLRNTADRAVHMPALDPVEAGEAPAPLWRPADSVSEEALELNRAKRADVQRRLALAGFDPHGFDGVFGPRTRQAVADFQAAWGFPDTGYLDAAVYADLKARTQEAYLALAKRATAQPQAAPKLAPVAPERSLAVNDSNGCARDTEGRIIAHQSFTCDIKGFGEKVISLGRTTLAHEEPGTVAEAGAPGAAMTAGAER